MLSIIFILALGLRLAIPSQQHITYIDEQWYMEAAKNMLYTGSQGNYQKSIGWPFIISIVFLLGVNNYLAIYASILLGSLTALNIFFIARALSRNNSLSLASAFIFSILPGNILWSSTAETNIPSLFFITLAIFFCVTYFKLKKDSLLYLCIASLAFASQFRVENYAFFILFCIGYLIFVDSRGSLTNLLISAVIFLLAAPNFIQAAEFQFSTNWIESDSGGALEGDNISPSNLFSNSVAYGRYLFDATFQPVIFSILFIVGSVYMFFKDKKSAIFLWLWFLLFWILYFGAWFQTFGGGDYLPLKTRFFAMFYPSMCIFFGYGILFLQKLFKNELIKKIIFPITAILVVLLFIPYTTQAGDMFSDNDFILETKMPEIAEKDIPKDCAIIANWPTILKSTTDLNVIDLGVFLDSKQTRDEILANYSCVLFFQDLTCSLWDEYAEKCRQLKSQFRLKAYKSYSYINETYYFYEIEEKS
jgi:hypothetical protein